MTNEEIKLIPEARTAAFFEQSTQIIVDQLTYREGLIIAVEGTNRKVRITRADAYPRVGDRYKQITGMKPGDLWSPPQRQIQQSLIVTKDESGANSGSCVRIREAEYFDPATQSFTATLRSGVEIYGAREGDIAKFLGLGRYEQASLKFVDSSETLYLVKGKPVLRNVTPGEANNQLRGLLGGGSK